jgi:putative peptidoglycan lipid II flippase
MIENALRFLSLEARGLHVAVYMLAASSLASSLLALLRDRIFAHTFGASSTLDIYYAAFRIPDLLFVATGALVSVYVLIPALAKRGEEEQKNYLDTICIGFSFLAIAVSACAVAAAPFFLRALFPELANGPDGATLVLLTRIMLLQPLLLGLSNIFAALTQLRHRYLLYSLSPLLYNVGIIFGVLVLYPVWGAAGLAWGVVLGAFLHAAIQFPAIVRDGFFTRIPRVFEVQDLLSTTLVSVPRSLALSMNQVAFVGLTALAAALSPGSIAVFMFAYNLHAVPLSVIGASYSVAAFPALAAALARGERGRFLDHVATAARYVLFWSVPAVALIIVLRAYLVRVILGSGAFDWTDTRLTAAVLALLALAIAAEGLQLLLFRAYYAAGRTFIPFVVSFAVAVGTLTFSVFFLAAAALPEVRTFLETVFRIEDVAGSEVLALALAFSAASALGTCFILAHFERTFKGFLSRIRSVFIQSNIAGIAGGAAAYGVLSLIGPLTLSSTLLSVFLRGFAAGCAGLIVCGLVYKILGNRELDEIIASVRSRLWKDVSARDVTAVASTEENA